MLNRRGSLLNEKRKFPVVCPFKLLYYAYSIDVICITSSIVVVVVYIDRLPIWTVMGLGLIRRVMYVKSITQARIILYIDKKLQGPVDDSNNNRARALFLVRYVKGFLWTRKCETAGVGKGVVDDRRGILLFTGGTWDIPHPIDLRTKLNAILLSGLGSG